MQKSLKRLVIDTATRFVYLSLIDGSKELDFIYQEGLNNHSVTIMPLLNEMLKKANLSLQDIDELIVGIGPGSYTGVRIGVTIAKMIGYLNQIPVYSVSSLALLASSSKSEVILLLIDARRDNAFMGLYINKSGVLECIKEDVLENIQQFKNTIKEVYEVIEEGMPQIEKIINGDLLHLEEDIHALVPNYLQVTEAERALHTK